jgi:hypothetical protein
MYILLYADAPTATSLSKVLKSKRPATSPSKTPKSKRPATSPSKAPKSKIPATSPSKAPKSKIPARKIKEKRQTWEYVPVLDGPSTYWQGAVEGKRTQFGRCAQHRTVTMALVPTRTTTLKTYSNPARITLPPRMKARRNPFQRKKSAPLTPQTSALTYIDLSSRLAHRNWMLKEARGRMRKTLNHRRN